MSAADYQRTLAWLYALEAAKGMDFKLERVARALGRLGNPHRAFPTIHVAGTNGKGSVAAMLHAVLGAGGYRVGLYTSPHLVRFTERVRVGDTEIAEDAVVALANELREVTAGIELTFFELGTVMAFVYFARAGVDIAVIEVGLGGRLDATNVIDPMVSVITTIGLDHTEFLGATIEAVATEKAGIIKPGKPVVIGRLPGEAEQTVRRIARERQAAVFALGTDFHVVVEEQGTATFSGLGWSLSGIRLSLGGSFQLDNMATALAVLTQLPQSLAVDARAVREGLAGVRWPGRLEQVSADPLVLLDGAHNLEGTRALARELGAVANGRRVHVLFAVMHDKPWPAMIEVLAPLCATAVVTALLPRGAAAADVGAVWARYCPTKVVPDPTAAWAAVRSCAKRGELVLVTGSLFLIGAVYPLCRGGWDVGDRRGAGSVAL